MREALAAPPLLKPLRRWRRSSRDVPEEPEDCRRDASPLRLSLRLLFALLLSLPHRVGLPFGPICFALLPFLLKLLADGGRLTATNAAATAAATAPSTLALSADGSGVATAQNRCAGNRHVQTPHAASLSSFIVRRSASHTVVMVADTGMGSWTVC